MPKAKPKATTPEDVEKAEAAQAAAGAKLEAAKDAYRVASANAEQARANLAAQDAVANMSEAERTALAQAIAAGGIESGEAVGTPNGGDN